MNKKKSGKDERDFVEKVCEEGIISSIFVPTQRFEILSQISKIPKLQNK